MNTKLIIKAQRLDDEFEHDSLYTWELNSMEELYNFRRMRIPPEHYTHVYVTIYIENRLHMAFVSNPMTLGQNVFNRFRDYVCSMFGCEMFR